MSVLNDLTGRYIGLPLDYEKEYHEAKKKLQYHEEQEVYHRATAQYYREQVEELEPLTDNRERAIVRAREAMEASEEFMEIRKRVKKKSALSMVDRMLRQIAEAGV